MLLFPADSERERERDRRKIDVSKEQQRTKKKDPAVDHFLLPLFLAFFSTRDIFFGKCAGVFVCFSREG